MEQLDRDQVGQNPDRNSFLLRYETLYTASDYINQEVPISVCLKVCRKLEMFCYAQDDRIMKLLN